MRFLYRGLPHPLVFLWLSAQFSMQSPVFGFEVAAMLRWWSGHAVDEPPLKQAHIDSVDSFLLRFAILAAIFQIALLITYLTQ